MTYRAEGKDEQEALDALELNRRARHEEVMIALANEREWARTHPLNETRKPKTQYLRNDEEARS